MNQSIVGLMAIQLLLFAGPAVAIAVIVAMKVFRTTHPKNGGTFDPDRPDHSGEPFTSEPLAH